MKSPPMDLSRNKKGQRGLPFSFAPDKNQNELTVTNHPLRYDVKNAARVFLKK